MFVDDPNPTFTHTVTAKVPVDGGFEDQPFKVTYRVLDDQTVGAFDMNEKGSAVAFLKAAVVTLDDIVDRDGKPVPYSDALRDRMIGKPYLRQPMARGYFAAVYEARMGN